MSAAIGAPVGGDADGAPEKFEFALAVTPGDALEFEIATFWAMSAEKVADRDARAEESKAAGVAAPGPKSKNADEEIANAAPMRAATGRMIAMGTNHRKAP